MRDKIIINGFTIENLTPIKKSFINKNKKFSARGFIDKKKQSSLKEKAAI